MSGIQIGRTRTFLAGADLSTYQYCFVKLGATQNTVVVATAATDEIIGVLDNAPKSGWEAEVVLLNASGTMSVIASAAIAQGAKVTATTGGKAVTATQTTAGSQPTVHLCGVAIDPAAASGDVIEISLANYKY